MKNFFLLLLLLIAVNSLSGQENSEPVKSEQDKANRDKSGNLMGWLFTMKSQDASDISTDGAVVKLIVGKDTLYTVSYDNAFTFNNIPQGKGSVTVMHVSFETKVTDVEIGKKTFIDIRLKIKDNVLNAVTVKGTIPLVIRSGDTLKFNAAAVKLLEGDVALEILKQMPGVIITEYGISVLGKNISRTYVNSRMIFGRNTLAALENIPASEVVSINTYEENKVVEPGEEMDDQQKVRVLDIKTKNPLFSATTAHVLLSGGRDIAGEKRARYAAGVTANFFSEQLLLSANVFANNINRKSNKMSDILSSSSSREYGEKTFADLGVEKTWENLAFLDNIRLKAGYKFDNYSSEDNNTSHRIYLPSDMYSSREYSDSLQKNSTVTSHNAILNLNLKINRVSVGFVNQFQIRENNNTISRYVMSSLNGNAIRNSAISDNLSDNFMEKHRLSLSSRWKRVMISGSVNYDRNRSDGSGFKYDSLASAGIEKSIESGPVGLSRSFNATGSLLYKTSAESKNSLSFEYSYNKINDSRKRYVTDATDENGHFTDSVKTYNYTNNHDTHKGSANLHLQLSKGKTTINLALALTSSDISRDELFPDRHIYNRRQTAVLPSLQISRYFSASGMDNVQLNYTTNVMLPSLEQWRDYLDTQNPSQLIAGNPELKQSYSHNIFLSTYFFRTDFSLFSLQSNMTFVNDKIAGKSRFFTEETMLPEWGGYIAREQSTLNSFVNLDGTLSGDISVSYTNQFKSIKSKVDIISSFMYVKDPSFIQESLVVRKLYSPSFSLRLTSNFSRSFRITVGGYVGYNYTENSLMQKDKALSISGTAQTELNILKKITFNTNYSFYANKGLLADKSVSQNHTLNAMLGFKLLKGTMEMSVAAYDILNKDTGLSRSVLDNYILTNRSFNYGRYVTINLAYRLFKSNTGLKQPKNIKLNDGGITE